MTALEWGVMALAAAAAVAAARGPRPWLVVAAVTGSLLVIAFGQPRWQLLPAAFAIGLLGALTLLHVLAADAPVVAPRTTAGVVLLGLLTSAVLTWALPLPDIHLAEGSRPVGTVAFDLVDASRTSPSGRPPAGGPRRTTAQAWYPTAADSGPRLHVTEDPAGFAAGVSQFLGLPAFALSHLGAVRTSARVGAPVDAPAEGLPVVLALHGWGGFRFAQAPLLEQLASDGHLVLALDHTDGSLAAQPVDGDVVPIDPALLPEHVAPAVYAAASTILERTFADDAHGLVRAIRDGDTQVPADVLAAADLDRLIVLGHSTGGGAAAMLCAEEPACQGLVGYDPWVVPVPDDVRAAGFAVPTLAISSEEWTRYDNDPVLRAMVDASEDATLVSIAGTKHRDVTVEALLSPLSARLGIAGKLGPERTHDLILQLTRAMIARTLGTGPGDPTLLETWPFPEVALEEAVDVTS